MKIYDFTQETAQSIMVYNSQDVFFTRVAAGMQDAHVGVMYIAAGGTVGEHQAAGDQLFMVIQGAGWVAGEDHQHRPIVSGEAAFWREGEWLASGSEVGMSVAVLEARDFQPYLPEI